ncbi:MAG: flavodoxin [Ruminiclostridium sp.]
MKKLLSIIVCAALAFVLTACSQAEQNSTSQVSSDSENSTSATQSESENSVTSQTVSSVEESVVSIAESAESSEATSDGEKTLIVYFTRTENTKNMAETIADITGGDIFEIEPVNAYPDDYTACTEVALKERDNDARPEISNLPESVSQYDNIIIGYPIWWHTAPMIIGTFLEHYDLTGIDVYPFSQSASMDEEQFSQSMDFIRRVSGNATVHDGLFAKPSDTETIKAYFEQNGLAK